MDSAPGEGAGIGSLLRDWWPLIAALDAAAATVWAWNHLAAAALRRGT